jgi:hypothetical protein
VAIALPLVGLSIWLALIEPRNDYIWSPEMAHVMTYQRTGNQIAVANVRNFRWTSGDTNDENWETRIYDLSQLKYVDVVSMYWKGPWVAHTYFSFVWTSGEALSISVEIRKEKGESYSPIGGFFKAYELAILAGDERDFYGWRTHFPGEDIQLFRTRANSVQAQIFLLKLLDAANVLAKSPAFYNTLTNNCTTEVLWLTDALGAGRPTDWRILASGYLPELLYDMNLLDDRQTMASLRKAGHILPAAKRALQSGREGASFSNAIRTPVAISVAPSPTLEK